MPVKKTFCACESATLWPPGFMPGGHGFGPPHGAVVWLFCQTFCRTMNWWKFWSVTPYPRSYP